MRTKLHSITPLERLNGKIKRHNNVVIIFPDESVTTRVLGALLLEHNDEWAVSQRYMTIESLNELRQRSKR